MLFKTTASIIQYAELTTIQFASVRSTINMVEQQHILPALGDVLYKSLDDAYTAAPDEATLSADHKSLLEKCRCTIGPLLCYYYAPKAEIKVGSAGAQRQESETNKTAYQNQVVNYREQNLREGEQATELLLKFLDENQDKYPDWAASTSYQKYKSLFIRSGSEFNDLFTSHSPYRNYMAMRSNMLDIEQNSIRPLLGDGLFDRMKAADQGGTPSITDKEKDLLFKIKKVIAYLTVAMSIPFLNIRMDANGITVMNSGNAQNDATSKRTTAAAPIINNLINACQGAAKSWLNNIQTFLDANAADFAAYRPDPLVTGSQTAPQILNSQPDDLNGTFGLI